MKNYAKELNYYSLLSISYFTFCVGTICHGTSELSYVYYFFNEKSMYVWEHFDTRIQQREKVLI